jgi:hypothetical protein
MMPLLKTPLTLQKNSSFMNKEICYFQNFFVSLCSDVLIQLDLSFTNPSTMSPFYLYTILSRVAISVIKIFLPEKTKKPKKKSTHS